MQIECPLSCGICTHSCNDTDVSCGAWATAGECEANPDAMLRLCPTSCGLCTPECKDSNKECPGWGAAGECNTNPEFMIRTCPVTCEACKATCKDLQPDCPGWVAEGECFKNPGYMCAPLPFPQMRKARRLSRTLQADTPLGSHPLPAHLVGTQVQGVPQELRRVRGRQVLRQQLDAVRDLGRRGRVPQQPAGGDEGVPGLVRGAPSSRPPPRRRLGRSADARPARLAQVCSTVCNDHDESCKGWAKEGECESNKAFMSRVCPCAVPSNSPRLGALATRTRAAALTAGAVPADGRSTCGVCQALESAGDKDEL